MSRHSPKCVVQLFFSHVESKTLHNAKFRAPTNLFSAVADSIGHKQTGGYDICVATGIAVRCRRDARCRHCTGKRLSRAIWSSFNKEEMSHSYDSTVAGPTARRNNALASKYEYPPFRYPPSICSAGSKPTRICTPRRE